MPQIRRTGRKRRVFAVVTAATAVAAASPATAQACPLQGDAKQLLAKQLNPYKNREDAPPVAQINPAATLNAVLAPGDDLQRWSRDSGAIFDGVVVNVKPGGIESVNCHAKDLPHRDTHIELALDPSVAGNQRVIVEVTPRWRAKMAVIADWSTAALKKQLIGSRVRITGWLFDDLEHKDAAENSNPGNTSNWRATVWEIHPITGIQVLAGQAVTTAAVVAPAHAPSHHRARSTKTCAASRNVKSCKVRHRLHRRGRPSS